MKLSLRMVLTGVAPYVYIHTHSTIEPENELSFYSQVFVEQDGVILTINKPSLKSFTFGPSLLFFTPLMTLFII